jgi:outer membrane protein TolC
LEAALSTAKSGRKDLQQAIMERKNREISRRFRENQELPDLSIFGAAGYNGLDERFGDTLDKMKTGKYYSWQAGLLLNIPIGNRIAKGNTLKARYEEERAELSLKVLEQRIMAEVREAWRSLRLAAETIEAAGKTRLAAEKRLDSESVRFRVGMATLTDVLRFQEEYTRAISSEKDAHVNYAKAVAGLEKAKGTLLQEAVR